MPVPLPYRLRVDFEILTTPEDESSEIRYPYARGSERPIHIQIGTDPTVGETFSSEEELHRRYVAIRDTDVYVPARQAFIATGGNLPYDVVFVVGFDGVESPLLEVRYLRRPDVGHPVTSTLIRTIRLDSLVKQAITEYRTAYRRGSWTEPGVPEMWRVSPQERQAVYAPAIAKSLREPKRRIGDKELKQVAESYVRALAERRNPTKAVEEDLRLPNRNVAKKWVQRSREAGFLQPAPAARRAGTA